MLPIYHEKARFVVCHTDGMELEDIILIRNTLNTRGGQLLISYCSDYITANACLTRSGEEIKGMCELLEQIKRVPQEVEKKRR